MRMRTIKQAIDEIKQFDPNTAISERAIRRLVTTSMIPSVKIGCKYLLSMESLEKYLTNGETAQENTSYGVIRPVNIKR